MNVPSTRPFFSEEDIRAIQDEIGSILRSGRLILGPYTRRFEESFRDYCGVKHAVGVGSCTAALEIVLRHFDVRGAEVIIPTNTFVATGNAVLFAGGTPVLADIKEDTLCLDPADMVSRITPRTRGVIAVHVAGLPCPDMDEIRAICQSHGLFLMEDVAHAHGATIDGRKTGSLGDAGCFSFYPTKVMTTGTGGMITTNDDNLAEYAVSLRHHGVGKGLHDIVHLGYDWLMDEVSALLGIYQLNALEKNLKRRNEVALRYSGELAGMEDVEPYKVPARARHSYYKYPLRLSREVDKKKLVERMQKECSIEIGTIYYPPCHLQPLYEQLFGFHKGMFPVADTVLERTCCLPIFAQMLDEEVEYVLYSLKRLLPECKAKPVEA